MVYALPTNGQTSWGTPLNNYILNVVLAQANLAETTVLNHQSATDPHSDRAYALSLVSPITSRTNQANGYVVLNSSGLIPNSLIPSAGGLSDVYDVSSSTYGGNGVVGVDNTAPIQNALNACATAGGGEVWIPNGTWTISSTLVIGNNTWLHLSPGAKIIRGINAGTGLKPAVMASNYSSATSLASITGNITVSGGIWDATNGGTQSDACVPVTLANATFLLVEESQFILNPGNPVIRLYGCAEVVLRTSAFITATPTSTPTVPAVTVQAASAAELPTGLNASMYTNTPCSFVNAAQCLIPTPSGGYRVAGGISHAAWVSLLGSTAAPASAHTSISVSSCAVNGAYTGLVTPNNWTTVTLTANQATHGFLDSTTPWQLTGNINSSTVSVAANNFQLDLNQWQQQSSLNLHWANSGTGVSGVWYRITPDLTHVELVLDLNWTGSAGGSQTVCTIPTPYRPSQSMRASVGGNKQAYVAEWFSNGTFQIVTAASSTDAMFGAILLPLDLV